MPGLGRKNTAAPLGPSRPRVTGYPDTGGISAEDTGGTAREPRSPLHFSDLSRKRGRVRAAADFGLPWRLASSEPRGGCCSLPAAAGARCAGTAEPPPARGTTRGCAPGAGLRTVPGRREMLERGACAPPGGGRAAGEAAEWLRSPLPRESPARRRPRVPQGSHRAHRPVRAKCAVPPLRLRSASSADEAAEGMSAGGAEAGSPPPRPCALFLLQ